MIGLPPMANQDGIQKYKQTKFGGYNHTLGADNGDIWDMKNMTSDFYPLLAPRRPRWKVRTLTKPNGFYAHDGLYWVDGTGFYADGTLKGTVTNGRKKFASLGAYIIILPDKKYYNRLADEFGTMEASFTGSAKIQDGTYAGEDAKANTIYASGAAWDSIFKVGDAVTISGAVKHESNNKTPIIREIDGDYLRFYENTFTIGSGGDTETLTIKRTVPDMDFLCENENRLWGCKEDTIYASKLGDIFNWNVFDGVATDSYSVNVGSAGDFTACCSYLGYPCFFKEEHIYKVYGDKPSNFQVMGSASLGVEAGSDASIAIAGETLFLSGPHGHCRLLRRHPAAGGRGVRHAAVPERRGRQRRDEVLRLDEGHGGRLASFVYDTLRGLWHQEDALEVVGWGWNGGAVFPGCRRKAFAERKCQDGASRGGSGDRGLLDDGVGGLLRVHNVFLGVGADSAEEGHRKAAGAAGAGRRGQRED